MEQSVHHLHLVFDEKGDDPLVLESSWVGLPNRENPNLRNISQAKPRLRALSILLLLAKYQEVQAAGSQQPLTFQAAIEDNTWICTLANAVPDVMEWVKRRFHLRDHELFVSGSVGSTHNPGGKKYPLVEFYPKKLPLNRIQLSAKPAKPLHMQPKLLRDEELLTFALKLESKHWKKSAIRHLYSLKPGENTILKSPSAETTGRVETPDEALFLSYAADVLQAESDENTQNSSHLNACLEALLEREVRVYQRECEEFFIYAGKKSLTGSNNQTGGTWSIPQIEVLRINCYKFSEASCCEVHHCFNHEALGKTKLAATIFGFDLHTHSDFVFEKLLASKRPITDPAERFYDDLPLLVPEFKNWNQAVAWGARNTNRHIALGTLMGHQYGLIDYLDKLCLPNFLRAWTCPKPTPLRR